MSLKIQNINMSYGNETILKDVSLQVEKGETLVLFGPSGTGKTTLLRLISGVVKPNSGQVFIDGENMDEVEPEHRHVGMAFQNFALFPHMTAFENIASPLHAEKYSKSEIDTAVQAIAKLLKIDMVLQQTPRQLSNGQKQRTSLARAMVANRNILLLDDPLRNVDAKLRFEMRLKLPEILATQGTTTIYVTQDYKEAMALGKCIAVMNNGIIEQVGTPEQIYHTPVNMDIARLFGDPPINFLDVVPQMKDNKVYIMLSDKIMYIDDRYAPHVDTQCVLGLRPEVLEFAPKDGENTIPVHLEIETPLNEKTVTLALTHRKREIMVSRPADMPSLPLGMGHLHIKPEQIMMFEKHTRQFINFNKTGA